MALQFSAAYRNNMLDELEITVGTSAKLEILSGSKPADCAAASSGTKLVEFDLASDWASNASGGSKSLLSLPLSATAVAGAPTNAGYFRLFASDGTTCHMQGTVTATGGGGDMTLDNVSIATGQTVNVTGFTLTAPGA
jgi:hypothetical protein